MSYKKIILISFFLLLLMSGVLSLVVSPSEIQLMADASNGMSMGTSYSYNVKMALQRFWSGQGYNNTAINSSSLNGTGYNTFLKDMASRKGWSIPNDTKSYKQIEQRLFDSFKKPAPAPGMTDVQPVTTSSGLNRYTLEANPNPPAKTKVSTPRTSTRRAPAVKTTNTASANSNATGGSASATVTNPPQPPASPGSTPGSPGSTPGSPGSTPGSPGSPGSTPGSTPGSPGSTPGSPGTPSGNSTVAPTKPEVKFSFWNLLLYAGITGSNEAIIDYRSGGDLESGVSSFGSGAAQGMGYYVSQNMLLRGIVWGASKTALGSSALASVAGAKTFLGMNPVGIAALVVITAHTIALNYSDNKDWDNISSIYANNLPVINTYVVPSAPALESSLFEPVIDPEINKIMTKSTNYSLDIRVPANSKFYDKEYSSEYDSDYVWGKGKFIILNEGVLSKTIKGLELYDFIRNEKLSVWERAYRKSMNFFSLNTASHSGDVIEKSAERVSTNLRENLIHGVDYYVINIGEEGVVRIDFNGACDVDVKTSKVFCDLRGLDLNEGYYLIQTRVQYNNLQKLELMTTQKNKMLEDSGCEIYPNENASDWFKDIVRNSCLYNFYDSNKGVYSEEAKKMIEEVRVDLQNSINEFNKLPSSAKEFILKVQNEEGINLTNLLNTVSVNNTSLKYSMNALVAGYPINTLLIVGNPPKQLTIESESVSKEIEYITINSSDSILYYVKNLNKKLVSESLGKTVVIK